MVVLLSANSHEAKAHGDCGICLATCISLQAPHSTHISAELKDHSDVLLTIGYVVSYGSFLAHGRANIGMLQTLFRGKYSSAMRLFQLRYQS